MRMEITRSEGIEYMKLAIATKGPWELAAKRRRRTAY